MSWDDDDWEDNANLTVPGLAQAPPAAPVSDDDEEEEVVDDDEPKSSEGPKPRKPVDPNKITAKKVSKQRQKELAAALEAEAEAAKTAKPMSKEEKVAEKLRLQKLVEESDHALTSDLFNAKKDEGKLDADAIAGMLQSVPLNSEEDFKNLALAVGKRVELEDKAFLSKEFCKELCRYLGRSIPGEDLAEVISVLGVVKNEKVKMQLNKKKKKGGKVKVVVSRSDFDLEAERGVGGGGYDDDNIDGDFM